MSSLPKWINDTVETVLSSKFRDCTILSVETIAQNLRRIQFKTDLQGVYFEPAYAIGVRVNERDFRNYSPFNFNKDKGTFDILFHLHNYTSAGIDFINEISPGDSLKILLPRGKKFFNPEAKIHFSIGDETSLGSSLSIKNQAIQTDQTFLCLHELEKPVVLETLGLYGYCAPKGNTPKIIEAITDFLREEEEALHNEDVTFYLTGNAKRLSLVRKFLKEKGIPGKFIRAQAYWMEGKKGL